MSGFTVESPIGELKQSLSQNIDKLSKEIYIYKLKL